MLANNVAVWWLKLSGEAPLVVCSPTLCRGVAHFVFAVRPSDGPLARVTAGGDATARFSTSVIPEGTQTMTRGRTRVRRWWAF